MESSTCSKCGVSWAGSENCPACGAPAADGPAGKDTEEFNAASRTCPKCGKYVRFVPSIVVWYCETCKEYVG